MNRSLLKLSKILTNTYDEMKDSSRRMGNAAKFIDFFVHDILDYAVLKGKRSNFAKNIKVFNIKESIE